MGGARLPPDHTSCVEEGKGEAARSHGHSSRFPDEMGHSDAGLALSRQPGEGNGRAEHVWPLPDFNLGEMN